MSRRATVRAARGAVVGERGLFLTEVVDELGNAGSHRGGEQRAGMWVLAPVVGRGAARFGGWMLVRAGPAEVQAPT